VLALELKKKNHPFQKKKKNPEIGAGESPIRARLFFLQMIPLPTI
jgi:hypothetical protein